MHLTGGPWHSILPQNTSLVEESTPGSVQLVELVAVHLALKEAIKRVLWILTFSQTSELLPMASWFSLAKSWGTIFYTRQDHLGIHIWKELAEPLAPIITHVSTHTNCSIQETIFNNIIDSLTKPFILCLVQAPQGTGLSYWLTIWAHTTLRHWEIYALTTPAYMRVYLFLLCSS